MFIAGGVVFAPPSEQGTPVLLSQILVNLLKWSAGRKIGQIMEETKAKRLSPKEQAILDALVANENEFVPTKVILDTVWGPDFAGEPQTVAVHISWLRSKIRPHTIISGHRRGYKFIRSAA